MQERRDEAGVAQRPGTGSKGGTWTRPVFQLQQRPRGHAAPMGPSTGQPCQHRRVSFPSPPRQASTPPHPSLTLARAILPTSEGFHVLHMLPPAHRG